MKKLLSLVLALTTVVICAASCAVKQDENTSASANGIETYTAYLENNLDEMPDELAIATAENASVYGVDMTDFANDGYLIRAEEGEVVILGKTDAGLDRAVRDYVKNGNDQDYFKVYNEGYRVKKLTIAGNDISEYAVVRDDDADEGHTYASSELVKYVEKTCGVKLPEYTVSEYASAAEKPARTILLTVDYPALGDEAFRIEVGEDGNMTISGGRYRGCLFGVYDLLHDIGWRFTGGQWFSTVTNTTEYLYESEHVDLTSELNRTESPAIPVRRTRTSSEVRNLENFPLRGDYSRGGYGILYHACHGMQNYHSQIFSGDYYDLYYGLHKEHVQPCYTNEEIYEAVEAWAFRWMEAEFTSRGAEEARAVDISQWDGFEDTFCVCKSCLKVKQEEASTCGAILRMANRLGDSLNESYPGAKVAILAYAGTETLPKVTKPNEHIIVSYCFYVGTCQNHCISGVDCKANDKYADKFEEWMEVTAPGQMVVWYYPFTAYANAFHSPFYTIIRDDIKYLAEMGIELIYVCTNLCNSGVTNDQLAGYLGSIFAWDYNYTDEEMYALIEEWLNIVYGDAGYYIYEYYMLCERAADLTSCWLGFSDCSTLKVNNEFMAERFDYMYSQFEKAEAAADTTAIEQLVERCKAGMLYMGVGLTYEDRYVNGTEEQRAVIAERYKEAYDIFKKYNIPVFDDLLVKAYVPDTLNLEVSPFDDWKYLDNKW